MKENFAESIIKLVRCPKIQDRTTQVCDECSYCYFSPKDCVSFLENDLRRDIQKAFPSLFEESSSTKVPATLENRIPDFLKTIGIPSHLLGYRYLKSAILMVMQDSSAIDQMTKTLYPRIGMAFNTTPTRIERAIRHAIECAWTRGDPNVLFGTFKNSIDPNKGKPTNSEFISMAVEILHSEGL